MPNIHRVLLITTGGTIAGKVAADKQDESMKRTAEEFSAMIESSVDYLNRKHNLEIQIESDPIADVDSSDILPRHWTALAAQVKERYDDFDSFIITHGTNTLGYTCAALSFALANPAKPIILTGSQVSAGLPGSTGLPTWRTPCALRLGRARTIRSRVSWQCSVVISLPALA